MSILFSLNFIPPSLEPLRFSEVTKARLATDDVGCLAVYLVKIAVDPDFAFHVAFLYFYQAGMH